MQFDERWAPRGVPLSEEQRAQLKRGLETVSVDAITTDSLSTDDTLAPGTDCRSWLQNRFDRTQTTRWNLNTRMRVLDSENIGRCRGLPSFDFAGVLDAVKHFIDLDIEVVVVCVRPELETRLHQEFGVGSSKKLEGILVSKSRPPLDDVLVLKEAFKHNCPVVS